MRAWLRCSVIVYGSLWACVGASTDPGLRADLFVADAQFVPGAMPTRQDSGPGIVSLRVPHDVVTPGEREEHVTGALEPTSSAVLIGLEHDAGYWIVNAGVPSLEEPDFPTLDARLAFARRLGSGALTLQLRAVDEDGHLGAEETVRLSAEDLTPAGALVVSLAWDSDADLDLHVVDPRGEEVWAGNLNSIKAPPVGSVPADPNAFRTGGILDLDSNANCQSDGRRREDVIWSSAPPSGSYQVRVAAASLCSAAAAHWSVEVWLLGQSLARGSGTALSTDVRFGAGRGAGVAALSFKVP